MPFQYFLTIGPDIFQNDPAFVSRFQLEIIKMADEALTANGKISWASLAQTLFLLLASIEPKESYQIIPR